MTEQFSIKTEENFLHPKDCQELIDIYNTYSKKTLDFDCENRPLVKPGILDVFDYQYLKRIVRKTFKKVGIKHYVNIVTIAKLSKGDHIPFHADNKGQKVSGTEWGPNTTPYRSYSSILYLNDNYEGGSLKFEKQNLTIQPKTGMLISFPGNEEYLHSVDKIINGDRYSLLVWYTQEKAHAEHHYLIRR